MHDKILAGTETFGQRYVLRNTGNGIVFSSERPGRNLVHDSFLSETKCCKTTFTIPKKLLGTNSSNCLNFLLCIADAY